MSGAQEPFSQRMALGFRGRLEAFASRAGYKKEGSIPESMSFKDWCLDLAAAGLKVDRKPFRLDNRPALVPLYDAIPTTREEAVKRTLTIQKATQLGLTVWEVLADIYMAKKWGPVNIGLFLPDQATASFKSEHRFMPIIRSAPTIHRELVTRLDDRGELKRVGEGNVLTRQIAESILMFLWTSGKVTTESRPMDVVSLDEVQEMALAEIDKVRARLGDSDVAFTMLLSTANWPDLDINFWYQQGSQEVWKTECESCGTLTDLSDPSGIFPARSIAYNTGRYPDAPKNEYVWCCPHCEAQIKDPQRGCYEVTNPGADPRHRSFLLPRTISPRITPRDMMEGWGRAKTGDQKKSFFNRTLARPYIDPDQIPVTIACCEAAAAEGMRQGVTWQASGRGCFMGIDQMGSFNVVVIKRALPDGRQALAHCEAIFDDNPFERCSELMDKFGVSVCVVEQLPNVNDARRFSNKHLGKVFLAGYADLRDDMMIWGDDLSRSDRKTAKEDRSRFTVTLNQYKAMQTALYRVRDGGCLFPDPAALEQDVLENGLRKRVPILRDWLWHHLTKTALVIEENPDERKPRPKVKKVGIDPHFAFANMLCDMAWARKYGATMVQLPEEAPPAPVLPAGEGKVETSGLPLEVVEVMRGAPGTCGSCHWFKGGMCEERNVRVLARDPSCVLYEAAD